MFKVKLESKALGDALLSGHFRYRGSDISLEDFIVYLKNARQCPDSLLPCIHGFEWIHDLQRTHAPEARKFARQLISLWSKAHIKFLGVHGGERVWQEDLSGYRLSALCRAEEFLVSTAPDIFCTLYKKIKLKHNNYLKKKNPFDLRALAGLLWSHEQYKERFLQKANEASYLFPKQAFLLFRDALEHHCESLVHKMAPVIRFFRHNNGYLSELDHGISLWDKAFEPDIITPNDIDDLLSQQQTSTDILWEIDHFIKCAGFGSSFILKKTPLRPFEWGHQGVVIRGSLILCDQDQPFHFKAMPQLLCERQSKTEVEVGFVDPFILQSFALKEGGIEGIIEKRTPLRVLLCFEEEATLLSPHRAQIGPFILYTSAHLQTEGKRVFLSCAESTFWEITNG